VAFNNIKVLFIFTTLYFQKHFPEKHMMRKLTLLLVAVTGLSLSSKAQLCGFDQAHSQLLGASPAYSQKVAAHNTQLAQMLQNNSNSLIINTPNGLVYDIPVVIHVIHTGGAIGTIYNPHDTVLQNMVNYLNQTYAATWYAYPGPTSGGTYIPIQFTLAKRDPNCNSTNGIVRVNGATALGASLGADYVTYGVRRSSANGLTDATMKTMSKWDNNDYYNIWVVNKIDANDGTFGTFVAGYAYFAGAPASVDGTVMLATQAKHSKITLPHEFGHAFSLYHVFEGDDPFGTGSATTCPSTINCATTGDLVCDTEPMMRSPFNCPSGTNPCTGAAWQNTQKNMMDYSSCQDRFTPGQRTRVLNCLTTLRSSLLSSLGTTPVGAAPAATFCTPSMSNPANGWDAGVYQVQLNDMNATSEGGYTSDGNRVYIDRACHQRANLVQGVAYPISVLTGPNREYVRVYIDYNNDGAFAASELVFSHNGSAGSAGNYETHTGSFTVPSSGITTCAPIRMRVITDRNNGSVAAPTACSALSYGQAEDFSVVIKAVANHVVSITQTTGSSPSCTGTSIGFTASSTGSPTSPTYKWFINGIYTGVTGTTYGPVSTLTNGDQLTARMLFTGACGPDSITSTAFTVSRTNSLTPSVTIAVTAGTNPGCPGASITFTATPANGGTAPTYQWYVGSTLQTGVTGATFTTTSLACNSTVYAVLNSNSPCVTTNGVSSNTITYTCGTQNISVSAAIISGTNPMCVGRNITFSATPIFGGSAPAYQWYINNTAVTGATGNSFTTNTLANGDSVRVQLTSNYSCATTPTAMSPAIYMVVVPNQTPTVTKAITAGSNPGCRDSLIQFTATAASAGLAPTYRWYVNGVAVSTNQVYNNTTADSGDLIWVRVLASGSSVACFTNDTAYSDTTVMIRKSTPSLPFISFIGHDLVSDSANVQWYGPAGIIPGATGPMYRPTVQGTYYALIANPLCGTGQSNILIVYPLEIGNYNMEGVALYPNPTTGLLTITWSAPSTTRITVFTPAGQAVLHDVATVASRKVIDLSGLASGVYFVTLQDEHGQKGAVRITVTH
jgi:hypothetical protein